MKIAQLTENFGKGKKIEANNSGWQDLYDAIVANNRIMAMTYGVDRAKELTNALFEAGIRYQGITEYDARNRRY